MKRFAIGCTLLFISVLGPTLPLYGMDGTKEEKPPVITVTGTATDEFPPDTAILSLAVETKAETVDEASRQNNSRSEKVISVLKKLLDIPAGDTIRTSAFSVQPVYEYDDKKRRNILTGYRVLNRVTVSTSVTRMVGELIDRGLKNGANNVDDIRFVLKDDRKACEGLLVKAVERARADAETVARALGTEIGGVRQLTPSCTGEQPPIIMGMARAKTMEAADVATPIEAGSNKVHGTVTVEFYLKR
ncbi:MAG: SIMPL domain-containing protein [Geobacter sp.]|nr:SIMPL domain-containing protein [Geobacter sp.]